MADTRINALSTATVSLSDDYLPIDGTTAGTKKLSAYSPSFGGNATVGGTLTVSNQLKVTNATIPDLWLQNSSGATSAYRNILIRQNSDNTFKFLSTSDAGVLTKDNIITGSNDTGAIGIGVAPGSGTSSLTVAGAVTISSTTASTSTSSGALVVGNGTSGGLGVGGAIYAGGVISTTSSSGVAVVGGRQWSIRANASGGSPPSAFVIRDDSLGSERVTIDASGNIAALSTTASTSTSSGALVVSGGVGVAGALTSGSGYYFGASADASLTRVSAGVIALGGAATSRIDINGATDVGIGFRQTGVRDWFINAKSAELQTSCLSAGSIASYESGVLVRVRDTTASDSTTSGGFVISGGAGVAGAINVGTFYGMVDGVTAPGTTSGYAKIYVDSADGDLKVKFGDGTVKTIATDS